jgi:hypothetical protein
LKTKDQILNEVRALEDALAVVIERFNGGVLDNKSVAYGLKEIWFRLKQLAESEKEA